MNIEEVVYIVGKYYQLKGDLIVRSEREKKEWYKQLATVKMFPIPIRTAADVFNPQR